MTNPLTVKTTRRRLLLGGSAGAALGLAPSWTKIAFGAESEVVIGHWGGAGPKFMKRVLIPQLQQKLPGARVFIKEGGGMDRMAQLKANPNNPAIDVLYVSAYDAKQMAQEGFTDPPDGEAVPEFNNLYPIAQDGAYGSYLHAITTIYDPAKVEAPTSWFDLWKPEYKGRVLVPNTKTIVNQMFVTATIRAMGGSETNPKDVQDARKKLLELRQNVVVFHTGTSQALTVIKSGDAWLGVAVAGYVYQAKDKGQSVDVSYPKEGALAAVDAMTVAKHSQNKEVAHGFVNLALSPSFQSGLAEELYWGPTNSKATVSDKTRARIVFGEEDVKKLVMPQWDVIMPQRSEWIDWWDKNMAS